MDNRDVKHMLDYILCLIENKVFNQTELAKAMGYKNNQSISNQLTGKQTAEWAIYAFNAVKFLHQKVPNFSADAFFGIASQQIEESINCAKLIQAQAKVEQHKKNIKNLREQVRELKRKLEKQEYDNSPFISSPLKRYEDYQVPASKHKENSKYQYEEHEHPFTEGKEELL